MPDRAVCTVFSEMPAERAATRTFSSQAANSLSAASAGIPGASKQTHVINRIRLLGNFILDISTGARIWEREHFLLEYFSQLWKGLRVSSAVGMTQNGSANPAPCTRTVAK